MKKPVIFCTSHFFKPIIGELKKTFAVFLPEAVAGKEDAVEGLLVIPSLKIDQTFIKKFPRLKIISSCAVGIDNIDVAFARKKNIIVTYTPNVVTEDTANLAIALLLSLTRNIVSGDAYVRAKYWSGHHRFPLGVSLVGKTLGIVGLGRVGKNIADKAAVFGLKIIYHARNKKDVPYTYYGDLQEMAAAADILIIACPGGESTKNIINEKILKALGPEGYLINISRGSTVNENDLIFALKNKIIAGAGLDVYLNEPHIREDFLALPNVILLPHLGAGTHETRKNLFDLSIQNLTHYFATGEALIPVPFDEG